MKILITGGSGYFGSQLLRRILLSGADDCTVLDIVDAADRPRDVRFVKADIRDFDAVCQACKGIDVVHHNVAQVPLAKNKELFETVNRGGTEVLLRAALQSRVRKVIHTSSSAVYGAPERNPVTEDMTPTPHEAYGRTKYEAELLCADYARKGLDVTIVRPRTILGPGRLGIFQILFEWVYLGANLPVFGRGDNVYQFVHSDDLADACIAAAGRPGATTYNCGADRFGTMAQALDGLCRHAGKGSKVVQVPMAAAQFAVKLANAIQLSPLGPYHELMYGRSMYFDSSKAKRELGWTPKYSNDEMFAAGYDWYVEHRSEILKSKDLGGHRSAVKEGILALVRRLL